MIMTMSPYRHRWWCCWSCIHRKVAVLQALHSVSLLTSLHPSPGLHLIMWLKRLCVAKGAKMWLPHVRSSQSLLCTGYFICSLFILTWNLFYFVCYALHTWLFVGCFSLVTTLLWASNTAATRGSESMMTYEVWQHPFL